MSYPLEQRPFPEDKILETVPTTGQIRLTESGLDFLEDNLGPIIDGAVPGGLAFCMPPTSQSGIEICQGSTCSDGTPGCDMTLTVDGATLEPTPPDTLTVDVSIGGLDESLPVTILLSNCDLELHKQGDSSQPGTAQATIPVQFLVDSASPTGDLRIEIATIAADLSDVGFSIVGPLFSGCNLLNVAANISVIRNLMIGQIQEQVKSLASEAIEPALCQACDTMTPCRVGTTCVDEICRYPNEECVPRPLGMEGALLLGTALEGMTETPEAEVDLMAKLADYAGVNQTGVTLGMRTGFVPNAIARCVPVDPTTRPNFDAIPIAPTFEADTKADGSPFMLGIGFHRKAIEHMLWSTWASGGVCLRIGTEFVDLISTGTFGLLLPSLSDLTGKDPRALYIKIVPQREPRVKLGANIVTESGGMF